MMPRRLADGADSAASKSGEAFFWGFISASSLILGAALGIWRLPSKVVRAALMAFGGGALIEALSIELFAHIIAKARGGHGGDSSHGEIDRPLVFLALGSALAGGLIFAALDRALSSQGAFLRKAATVQAYVSRLRGALMRRLVKRLRVVPIFAEENLSLQQLQKLARCMVKERYAAGEVIFSELHSGSSIFFLLSGKVNLAVTTRYAVHAGNREVCLDIEPQPKGTLLGVSKDIQAASSETHRAEDPMGQKTVAEAQLDNSAGNGTEEVVDWFRLGANDIFGEMALFTGETLQAQATAIVPSTVLRIPSAAIHHLLASNKRLQNFVAMTAIDRLRETEVFCRCTPSTVQRLVSFMKQAEFLEGDVLFHDIDALCPIYFVVLGAIEVMTSGASGKAPLRHTVSANGLLGTEHLVLGRALHATATALERTTVLIVQRSDIDKLCARDERFRQALISSAVRAPIKPSSEDLAPIALEPPEGSAAPAKYGVAGHLEDLGWRRQETPQETKHPGDISRTSSPCSRGRETPTPSELGEDELDDIDNDNGVGLLMAQGSTVADLSDLLANADAAAAAAAGKGVDASSEAAQGHGDNRGVQAAMMIWLGILIDAVPESIVMGILVNTATRGTLVAFVVGVFLANFPEAMSSAGTMLLHGMRKRVIMPMWSSITVMTGIGAFVGAQIFPPGSAEDPAVQKIMACIEGLCGGAMLCMIANTVLPEAFEQGGNVTGLSTLLGFLVAITVSVAH